VQQILINSARHWDMADPTLTTNGAGYRVSHNVGFGVPDAGLAVALARGWPNLPPATSVTLTATGPLAIPEDGLRLLITGTDIPAHLTNIHTLPGEGIHPDDPTVIVPLVYMGLATNPITIDLTGQAALIQRGEVYFSEKINRAAQASAALAIIFNNRDGNELVNMGETGFAPIPAVFIGQTDGEALRDLLQQNTNVLAQLQLDSARYEFTVSNTLLLEHVAVHVATDHPRRGDLRITLLSPQGTRSVLQHLNFDDSNGPVDWTYCSVQHFYESSVGTWTVAISDEAAENQGTIQSVSLTLYGIPITDTDQDSLDDIWEMVRLKNLSYGPKDDPDGDGFSNAREQIIGTNPRRDESVFQLDLSVWNQELVRLSWPSTTNHHYEVWRGENLAAPLTLLTNLPGAFPYTEWYTPYTNSTQQFFQVRTAQ
jgi:subtilisin-like proprotein convertase family protein